MVSDKMTPEEPAVESEAPADSGAQADPKEDAAPPEEDAAPSKEDAAPPKEDAAPPEEEAVPDEDGLPQLNRLDDGIKRRWYAIHAHSGQEGNVRKSLLLHAEQEGIEHLIANVLVPMEEVAEFKSGEKRISKRKYFPGYVLIQLPENPEKDPDLWHLIKNTPGVTGFIGSRTVPVPLEDEEVEAIVKEIRGESERPKPKVLFEDGERVKVIDGAFANFLGSIAEVNEERGKLKVMIEIFERLTSVEVEFWQVEKI